MRGAAGMGLATTGRRQPMGAGKGNTGDKMGRAAFVFGFAGIALYMLWTFATSLGL